MYLDGQKGGRIGCVSIDIKRNSYRLRFTYPEGERNEIIIARATSEGWVTAVRAAKLINRDIDLGDFDDTYTRYSPKHASKLAIAQKKAKKEYSLKDLWEAYKEAKKGIVAETTQKRLWKDCDRYLSKTPAELLGLDKAPEFLAYLRGQYAPSTIATLFRSCLNPAVNLGVTRQQILENPFKKEDFPKIQAAPPECFEPDEIQAIIRAFRSDEFNPESSRYAHSYYAAMVEFLILTGCRPEEVHALTWDDIKSKKGKVYIRFNKAYSKGILLPHTKTREIRLFPCNAQMTSFLEKCPKITNPNHLVFPSVEGGYVCQDDWRRRNWKTVLNGLVKTGEVGRYLRPYCLRHTFITRLVEEGMNIATIARVTGTSTEMIVARYLAYRRDFEIPEI